MKKLLLFTCFVFVLFACGKGPTTEETATADSITDNSAPATDTEPASTETADETGEATESGYDADSAAASEYAENLEMYREEDFGEGDEAEEEVEEDPWEIPSQELYYAGTFNNDNDKPVTVTIQEYGGGLLMGFIRRHDQKEWMKFIGKVDSARMSVQLKPHKTVDYKSVDVATLDGLIKGDDIAGTWSGVDGTSFPFFFKHLAPSKVAHRFTVETTGSTMENTDIVVNSISIYNSDATLIQTLTGMVSKRQDGANRGLFVKDVNFDGYPDLCQWGSDFNVNIWVYDEASDKYVYVPESVGMSEPTVDYHAKQIIATEVFRRGYYFLDRYIFKDGHFYKIESTEYPNSGAESLGTKRYEIVNGKSVEVKN